MDRLFHVPRIWLIYQALVVVCTSTPKYFDFLGVLGFGDGEIDFNLILSFECFLSIGSDLLACYHYEVGVGPAVLCGSDLVLEIRDGCKCLLHRREGIDLREELIFNADARDAPVTGLAHKASCA